MANTARRRATYDDVLAAPDHVVAELVDGELHVNPRPAAAHAVAASVLGGELSGPFHRGRSGPGGWILLAEPELHLGDDVLVPDLAGWRRERLPRVPDAAYFTLAPDWVCEILSPRTAKTDRTDKLPIYARAGVSTVWLLDPVQRTLEAFSLEQARWVLLGVWRDDAEARVPPFDAIVLELGALWADME